ncbi:pyruvate kinase [Rhabdothermincola sediminis]|uniref:pyruvate kinase n=1 Tax=Rhabdothermincola sediminis TaxID=2751370 RepID=UPI001AA06B26|nr:pyruvate kinase [Rhabdothermincola sediminis]
MPRRTKIIATIGPTSDSEAVLKGMIEAGMDVARLSLAHESLEQALARYHRVRKAAADFGRTVGILVDLPGPKVRAGAVPDEGLLLLEGQRLRLTPGTGTSTAEVIQVDYDQLLSDIHPGDTVAFGDGAVVVEALGRADDHIEVSVIHGGVLKGRPGIHIPSDRLRLTSPTSEDLRCLDAFIDVDVDMVALSFVRSAHDVRRVGVEPHPRGPLIVAKVETRAAVENLDGIIEASGAVMVARGDLGSEFPIEELPHLQKRIIHRCIALGRPAITATQMLESMIQAPIPTRAEASDVANAVFDGSSALMLSGESAVGVDPVHAVATMARIAERADDEFDYDTWADQLQTIERDATDPANAITDAMTSAAHRAAAATNAAAIICISRSGFTVRSIARFRPRARIIGFSTHERTVRQLTMSWGSVPYHLEGTERADHLVPAAIAEALRLGEVKPGDLVVLLFGTGELAGRATDTLRLLRIP